MESGFIMTNSGFAPAAKRASAPRFPSASLGVFWFLGSEFAIFVGLAIIFLAGRRPDWALARQDLNVGLAALGTLVLLASGITMARAHAVARSGQALAARRWLGVTLTLGVVFLVCTGAEAAGALSAGHGLGTHRFWAHWYLLTGMHASRVLGGMAAMLLVTVRRGAERHVGALGLYWLFVCLVWFAYFPLLYIAG